MLAKSGDKPDSTPQYGYEQAELTLGMPKRIMFSLSCSTRALATNYCSEISNKMHL